nr:putative disease resistance protein [Quercus suber]
MDAIVEDDDDIVVEAICSAEAICGSDTMKKQTSFTNMISQTLNQAQHSERMCTNLRKLDLTCFHSESALKTAQCISRLDNLHTLRLTSSGDPLNLMLSPMKDHQSLSNLYLFGGIEDHRIGNLPRNLNILTLSASRLTEDPMRVLGKLPQLRVLNLFNHSYLGQEMTCHADQNFPELRVLKLWILGKLELLTVENGAMPQLRELEIRVCEKLRSSEGLDQLPALKELILRNMPQDFVEDARRRLGNEKLLIK